MYISPNHPNPPRPSAPPQETGRRLATFPRGRDEELRVNLAEYEGHPYISLRVWAAGNDGQFFPIRGKGLSVRVREVAGLAEVLAAVAGELDQVGRVPQEVSQDAEHRGPGPLGPLRRAVVLHQHDARADGPPFDEFAGADS